MNPDIPPHTGPTKREDIPEGLLWWDLKKKDMSSGESVCCELYIITFPKVCFVDYAECSDPGICCSQKSFMPASRYYFACLSPKFCLFFFKTQALSQLLPCHRTCRKTDMDREEVRASLNDLSALENVCFLFLGQPFHLFSWLSRMQQHNNASILGVLPPRNAKFLTGLFGLLCCPAGIHGDGTHAFKRRGRKETMQWKWRSTLINTQGNCWILSSLFRGGGSSIYV